MEDLIKTVKSLVEDDGCRAISGACGFFGNYQQQVRAAVDVPVGLSSLVQIPFIQQLIKPGQKIGILTANKNSLTQELLRSCGVTDTSNLVVKDALQTEEFATVVNMRGYFDNTTARQEILTLAKALVDENDDLGAILLECSDMPPYSADIQRVTQLPVFDFITLISWLKSGVAQRPYSGWI